MYCQRHWIPAPPNQRTRNMRRLIFSTCVVLATSLPALSTAQSPANLSKQIELTLEHFHELYAFPGATAAIILPDGSVATAATGLADREDFRAMTSATPMLAASIGKTFVAATILALEDEDLVSRGDLLSVHLGHYSWFESLPNAKTITIDHLLHHSTGLADHVHLPAFQHAWAELAATDRSIDPQALVAFVLDTPPLFQAGTSWAYSDTGYILLGLVIEKVTGKPWEQAVRERFIDPLGLTDTFASNRPDLPGLAVGYTAADNPFGMPERTADSAGRLLWNPAVESAGGGFASTSCDLARWGHRLFSGTALKAPYLDRLLAGVPMSADIPGTFYGAGVAIHTETARGWTWGHGGWIPGYVSSLRHYADHGVTVVFQINTDSGLLDDSSDLVSTLEAALADIGINAARRPPTVTPP